MTAVLTKSPSEYQVAFDLACALDYPEVDAFERRCGFALDREQLEGAARVLACPLKANPPHWQHGRVIYAAAGKYLHDLLVENDAHVDLPITLLDIGSAKGFSALCLQWAAANCWSVVQVESVDVIDPAARVSRNTVAEVEGLKTLTETLSPWEDAERITFLQMTGLDWLSQHPGRVHVAFVDGKHEGHVVRQEGKFLADRQETGDLAIFDDCQISAVSVAVVSLEEFYKFEYLSAGPRDYAIGWRR